MVAETVVLADEEGGHKRNRSPAASPFEKIMLPPSASANAPANSVKTNRFFLEGPIPASRGGGGGGGSKVSGKANWKNVFGRYLLPPSGEIVVGRDSLRDTHPANNTKLRVGIDKREEVSEEVISFSCVLPFRSGDGMLGRSCVSRTGRYGFTSNVGGETDIELQNASFVTIYGYNC